MSFLRTHLFFSQSGLDFREGHNQTNRLESVRAIITRIKYNLQNEMRKNEQKRFTKGESTKMEGVQKSQLCYQQNLAIVSQEIIAAKAKEKNKYQ